MRCGCQDGWASITLNTYNDCELHAAACGCEWHMCCMLLYVSRTTYKKGPTFVDKQLDAAVRPRLKVVARQHLQTKMSVHP
jgi:hypothetical protein